MSKRKLRNFIVRIESGDQQGSGCILQPGSDEYSYIFTANHIIADENNINISRMEHGKTKKEKIEVIKVFRHPSKYVPNIDDDEDDDDDEGVDAAILKVNKVNSDVLLPIKDPFESYSYICAYPGIRALKRDSYRQDKIEFSHEQWDTGYYEAEYINKNPPKKWVDGCSGGGDVKPSFNNYYFSGILRGMAMPDEDEQMGKIEFIPINLFKEIIEANKIELVDILSLEIFESVKLEEQIDKVDIDGYDKGQIPEQLKKPSGVIGEVKTPELIKEQMEVLLNKNKVKEALELVNLDKIDETWAHLAIGALVFLKNPKAKEILVDIQEKFNIKTILKSQNLYISNLLRQLPEDILDFIREPNESETKTILEIIDISLFFKKRLEVSKSINTEYENQCSCLLLDSFLLLRDKKEASKLAENMISGKWSPIVKISSLVLGELVDCPDELIEKMENRYAPERNDDLNIYNENNINGVGTLGILKGIIDNDWESTYEIFKFLTSGITPENPFNEIIYTILFQGAVDSKNLKGQFEDLFYGALPGGHLLIDQMNIIKAFDSDEIDLKELEASIKRQSSDETSLLDYQFLAVLETKKGNYSQAVQLLNNACQKYRSPLLYKQIISYARRGNLVNIANDAYLDLIKLAPQEITYRNEFLGYLLLEKNTKEALKLVTEIFDQMQLNEQEQLTYAATFYERGFENESIEIFDRICKNENASVQAFLQRTLCLRTVGRSSDAFNYLFEVKDLFFNDPQFLFQLMELSYETGNEEAAPELRAKLISMWDKGEINKDVIKPVSFDELIQMRKDRQNTLNTFVQAYFQGEWSWTFIDNFLTNSITRGLFYRTQVDFATNGFNENNNRAALTIYATDSFSYHKCNFKKEYERLELQKCSPLNTSVVCDLSALNILASLEILSEVLDYYNIIIPDTYRAYTLQESHNLVFSQKSQHTIALKIKDFIQNEKIRLDDNTEFVYDINEYSESGSYRIIDIVTPLLDSGHITDYQFSKIRFHAQKEAEKDVSQIQLNVKIRIDDITLNTLVQTEIFEEILSNYHVTISTYSDKYYSSIINSFNNQKSLMDKHTKMWKIIKRSATFMPLSSEVNAIADGNDLIDQQNLFSDAAKLAIIENLPFLCDDRCNQRYIVKYKPGNISHGTDRLIAELLNSGKLEIERAAELYFKLIKWNYRFLLLTPEILKVFADKYAGGMPGHELRYVALYLHDCMRDPGLEDGLNPTDARLGVAYQFYDRWSQTIVEFIVDIWLDSKYSDKDASSLTEWAISEFLPQVPIGSQLNPAADKMLPLLQSHIVLRFFWQNNFNRANQCIRQIAYHLGISKSAYNSLMEKLLDAYGKEIGFKHKIAEIAFAHLGENVLPRNIAFAVDPEIRLLHQPKVDDVLCDILLKARHTKKVKSPVGPYLFYEKTNSTQISATRILDLVLSSCVKERQSALKYLCDMNNIIGQKTLDSIVDKRVTIEGDNNLDWVKAAKKVVHEIERDFNYNLIGLQQSLKMHFNDGIEEFIPYILNPALESINTVSLPKISTPSGLIETLKTEIDRLALYSNIGRALTELYDLVGHIPVKDAFQRLVKKWRHNNPNNDIKLWKDIQAWKRQIATPIAEYHALVIGLSIFSLLSTRSQSILIGSIIKFYSDDELFKENWGLHSCITKHYIYWFETLFHRGEGEIISGLAWFISEKVCKIFNKSAQARDLFLTQYVDPASFESELVWQIATPLINKSILRNSTHLASDRLWRFSLLASFNSETINQISSNRRWGQLQEALFESLVGSQILEPVRHGLHDYYAFQTSHLGPKSQLGLFPDMVPVAEYFDEFNIDRYEPDKMVEQISEIWNQTDSEQMITCSAFYFLVHHQNFPEEKLWEKLKLNKEIIKNVSAKTNILPLIHLFEGLNTLAFYSKNLDFRNRLPYVLLYGCKQKIEDPGRRRQLILNLIYLCARVNAPVPLIDLISSPFGNQYKDEIHIVKRVIKQAQKNAPQWAAGRIRSILAALNY